MIYSLLPVASFAALCILAANLRPSWGWRRVYLHSTIVLGVYAIASLEILSLFRWMNRGALITTWLLPIAVSVGLLSQNVGSYIDPSGGWSGLGDGVRKSVCMGLDNQDDR